MWFPLRNLFSVLMFPYRKLSQHGNTIEIFQFGSGTCCWLYVASFKIILISCSRQFRRDKHIEAATLILGYNDTNFVTTVTTCGIPHPCGIPELVSLVPSIVSLATLFPLHFGTVF